MSVWVNFVSTTMCFPAWISFLCCVLFAVSECRHIKITKFASKPNYLCDLSERMEKGCLRRQLTARGLIECTTTCTSSKTCVGVSLGDDDQCYIHDGCPETQTCSNTSSQHNVYLSRCKYGVWDVATQSCKCVNGFRGVRCDQGYTSCGYLNPPSDVTKRTHRIFLDPEQDGIDPFPVYCSLNKGGSRYELTFFRNGGRGDFNKTWQEYAEGFYIDDAHFWMGLESWKRVINAGCSGETKFAYNFSFKYGGTVYRKYMQFKVTSHDYRIGYNSQKASYKNPRPGSMNFGKCLEPLKNKPFSTWDRDNDGVTTSNCASKTGSGWWYSGSCNNNCNMLGYGFDYIGSKPSYQLFSLKGVDMTSTKVKNRKDPMFAVTKNC